MVSLTSTAPAPAPVPAPAPAAAAVAATTPPPATNVSAAIATVPIPSPSGDTAAATCSSPSSSTSTSTSASVTNLCDEAMRRWLRETDRPTLLVVGGDADPNILMFIRAALRDHAHYRVFPLLVGATCHPSIIWDIDHDTLVINGHGVMLDACFIRYDVFTQMSDPRPEVADRASAWHTALIGWVLCHEQCRIFNRGSLRTLCNKPQQLCYAKQFGLAIPRTIVSNDCKAILSLQTQATSLASVATPTTATTTTTTTTTDSSPITKCIVKPINGGGYCQELDVVMSKVGVKNGVTASPAICQFRLIQPEYRIYLIGKRVFAFAVITKSLDYRVSQDATLALVPPSWYDDVHNADCIEKLRRVADAVGLTYSASDFKTDPSCGRLLFMEINSQPMFASFDEYANGAIIHALIEWIEDYHQHHRYCNSSSSVTSDVTTSSCSSVINSTKSGIA